MTTVPRIRFEIRLPIYYNDGRSVEPEKHVQTKNEVYEKFGACMVLTITEGDWRDPSTSESFVEHMGGFFVDVDKEKLEETLAFFNEYKKKLQERFQQQEIYIVGYEVYVI